MRLLDRRVGGASFVGCLGLLSAETPNERCSSILGAILSRFRLCGLAV
jgi:hypothetical protein